MSAPMRSRSAMVSFAALLLALSLRVLVPTGWMPAPEGGFRIVPCVAAAPKPQVHSQHHGHHQPVEHHDPKQHDNGAKDCPFAPLLASAALPNAIAPKFALLAPTPLSMFALRTPAALPTGPPAPPPPSTGPPTLA